MERKEVIKVAFSEQSLQGYLPSLKGPIAAETFRYQHANAEVVLDGEITQIPPPHYLHNFYRVWHPGLNPRCPYTYNAWTTSYKKIAQG